MRILLVDDEPRVLTALQHDLAPLNGEMEAFSRPRPALARAGATTFDLAIIGYRKDATDDLNLVNALQPLQPGLIVIILSGLADLRVCMQAHRGTDVFRHLTKPWDADELCTIVREALLPQAATMAHEAAPTVLQRTGALAALEAKYPGITDPDAGWSAAHGDG